MRLPAFLMMLWGSLGCSVLYPLDYRTAPIDAMTPDGTVADASMDVSISDGAPPCPAGFDRCTGGACMDIRTNTDHCGRCNNVCALANATPRCEDGRCVVATCNPGWGDCDGDPSNGCETHTQSNASHCGMCRWACPTTGGTSTCREGVCRVAMCAGGFADCDGSDSNGCEVNIQSSLMNCGGCGMACPARPHSTVTCADGRCSYTCNPGWGDCDGDASNGCEVNLRETPAHCGACNRPCSTVGGMATCTNGTCSITCAPGWGNCDGNVANGCEVDLRSTAEHCGSCGIRCSGAMTVCANGTCGTSCPAGQTLCAGVCVDTRTHPGHCGRCGRACPEAHNATTLCTSGECTIACVRGFANCDGSDSNGCEVNIQSSLTNCGSCGMACPSRFNSTVTCADGRCSYTCNPGWGDCDGNASNGCEVNLQEAPAHCGGCNRVCNLPNATPTCRSGVCRIGACNRGFGDCDGDASNGCEVNLQEAPAHCGGCNRVCTLPNATPTCRSGACRIDACNRGFDDCDGDASNGCEVNLTSTTHCRRCNNSCPLGASCDGEGCCGLLGMPCCQPGNTCNTTLSSVLTCNLMSMRCETRMLCGNLNQPCCPGGRCTSPLNCVMESDGRNRCT